MSDQAYITMGWILAGVAIAVAVLALFLDMIRQLVLKRRRCPRCWYDMAGTPGLTCSECGRTAKRERNLHRGRRRWWYVWIALVMLIGSYALHAAPEVKERGWAAAIPSSILVFVAPVGEGAWETRDWRYRVSNLGDPLHPLLIELNNRSRQRELASWQWHVFFDRVFREHPNELRGMVNTRGWWPTDVPVAVEFDAPWFAFKAAVVDVAIRVRLTGTQSEWKLRAFGIWGEYPGKSEMRPHLGVPPENAGAFQIDIQVLVGAKINKPTSTEALSVDLTDARTIWSGTSLPVRVGGRVEDVLQPYVSEEANRAIIRTLEPSLIRSGGGSVSLCVRRSSRHIGAFDGSSYDLNWSLGMAVEARHDGEVVAAGSVLYPMVEPGLRENLLNAYPLYFELEWCSEPLDTLDDGDWQITLRGDPMVALYDLSRESYWAGEVVVPTSAPK